MKKVNRPKNNDGMLQEYDFRNGTRGKYAARFAKGIKVVTLDPDVAKVFPDSESVNQALRACASIIHNRPKRRKSA